MDKSVLKKALADSEEPTPGYLFRDIAKMTFVDAPTQDKLVQYLFEKLDVKSSVHVLAKTLNVIKHLCKEGHVDFQKQMQRRSDDMKQFASYRGPTDPKYGDKLNERVRLVAREAIDAAFSHRRDTTINVGQGQAGGAAPTPAATTSTVTSTAAAIANKVTGFVTGNKVSESGSTMPGANERCAPMPTTNKWAEHMAKEQAKAGNGAGFGFITNVKDQVAKGFGMWEHGVQSKEERMMAELNSGAGGFQAVEIPGQFANKGGAGGSKAMQQATGGANDGGGWKFTQEGQGASGFGGAGGAGGAPAKKVQTVIEREVEKLASMKATPKRVELAQFNMALAAIVNDPAHNYTWEDVAQAIDATLSGKNAWQTRLNSLSAVEYILRADDPKPGDEFKDYFIENPEDIQRNVAVVQEALKEKAQKVLKILGVPDRLEVAKQQAEQKKNQPSVVSETVTSGANQQTNFSGTTQWSSNFDSGAATTTAETGGGFLDGMVVKSSAGANSNAAGASKGKAAGDKTTLKRRGPMSLDAFENNNGTTTTTTTTTSSGWGDSTNNNGWGNDAGNSGWGAAPAPAQQQQQFSAPAPVTNKSNNAVNLDDIFGGAGPAPAPVAVQQQQQSKPQPTQNTTSSAPFDPFASAFGGQQQQQQQPVAPAPAPVATQNAAAELQKQQLAAQVQQQMMLLMQQSMAAAQRGDTQTATLLMQQQQQLMAQMTAMMGGQ